MHHFILALTSPGHGLTALRVWPGSLTYYATVRISTLFRKWGPSGFAITLIAILATACRRDELPETDARFLAKWMEVHFALARSERLSPLVASRIAAYGAVTLYEGMYRGTPTLRSLAGQLNGLDSLPSPDSARKYDWPIVTITAERMVLDALLKEGLAGTRIAIEAVADSQVSARIAQGVSRDVVAASVKYGSTLAAAIIEWAARDGFARTRGLAYSPPRGRRYWVNTSTADQYTPQSLSAASDFVALDNPSAMMDPGAAAERALLMNRPRLRVSKTITSINPTRALEPHWGSIRPFVLKTGDDCAPEPPVPYSEKVGSEFHEQGKAVYTASQVLTEAQRQTAFFWADTPGQTGTPAGHWLSIVGQLVTQYRLPPDQAIETYALTTIAIADAFISCWRTKYLWNVPRPVTYLRRAIDPKWRALIVTPPFPEYTSGHSVLSAAAARVLSASLGEREFTDDTQLPLGHPPRHFKSFTSAAAEAGISRLYGGIHYPMAIENGLAQGRCVGARVIERIKTRDPE